MAEMVNPFALASGPPNRTGAAWRCAAPLAPPTGAQRVAHHRRAGRQLLAAELKEPVNGPQAGDPPGQRRRLSPIRLERAEVAHQIFRVCGHWPTTFARTPGEPAIEIGRDRELGGRGHRLHRGLDPERADRRQIGRRGIGKGLQQAGIGCRCARFTRRVRAAQRQLAAGVDNQHVARTARAPPRLLPQFRGQHHRLAHATVVAHAR